MKPLKICLTDLAHTHSVGNSSLTIPLNIGFLKSYAVAAHSSSVNISLFKHPEKFLCSVSDEQPEIIGFSNYGWNQNLNWSVGKYVRKRFPKALIVAGGPNIDPDLGLRRNFLKRHDYVNFLIVDAGEEPFAELIDWWREGEGDYSLLPRNVVWLEDDKVKCSDERPLKKNIDKRPSPYLEGYLDEFIDAGMIPMFETNRGCPFLCTFCAWGAASKNLVQRLDFDTCLAEISYVGTRSTAQTWIVCDANFGILQRDVEIAKAIRKIKDEKGFPEKCHIWLAKNVTERNLEIGSILGDMTVPVMAIQSLDDEVLVNIKRDNISTETYVEYQKKFHKIGSRTYSDLIVPLPGETLQTHIKALSSLFGFGVDVIATHNMRLLAGAETNSTETRQKYDFLTRYRLIHGDAGRYRCPDGTTLEAFEYEESLRQTDTIGEDDLFYLRKLHFLVNFAWNIEVYKPLLKVAHLYGVNPIDILQAILEKRALPDTAVADAQSKINDFFIRFDQVSHSEWFDSAEEIEAFFASEQNFERLIDHEFEKLNISFSVILLQDYKQAFDVVMQHIVRSLGHVPGPVLDAVAAFTFARFPALDIEVDQFTVSIPSNLSDLTEATAVSFRPSPEYVLIYFSETPKRARLRSILKDCQGRTLSKILDMHDITLSDLQLTSPLETTVG